MWVGMMGDERLESKGSSSTMSLGVLDKYT